MFGQFSYLIYMLLFTFIPIGILWIREFNFLWKNLKVVGITVVSGIIFQLVADPFAENWRAWFFTKEKILGIWLVNFPIENTIFFLLVPLAICSACLTFIHYQETGKFDSLFKKYR